MNNRVVNHLFADTTCYDGVNLVYTPYIATTILPSITYEHLPAQERILCQWCGQWTDRYYECSYCGGPA